MEKVFEGYNGTLILTDNAVIIKRGLKWFFLGGGTLRWDKTIPYQSIVAVQLKEAWRTAGYIQLTLMWGSEAKAGLFQSTTDENSINFHKWKNKDFLEAKRLIEERLWSSKNQNTSSESLVDQLEKLWKLLKNGILTQEEFEEQKKILLGK